MGARRRSSFIEAVLRRVLAEHARTEALEQAFGSLGDIGHEWDDDPAAWVRTQRADVARAG